MEDESGDNRDYLSKKMALIQDALAESGPFGRPLK
jgi:hypothetical protein